MLSFLEFFLFFVTNNLYSDIQCLFFYGCKAWQDLWSLMFSKIKFLWIIAQLTWQMDETDHICYCCKTTKIKQVCKNIRLKWAAVAVFGLTGWLVVTRQTWGRCWPWHVFVPPHEVTIQLLSILVYSRKLIPRLVSLHFDVLVGNFWCWKNYLCQVHIDTYWEHSQTFVDFFFT